MINWYCTECGRERQSKDNVIMKVCETCVIEMQKVVEGDDE
jgi:NMD protein affecting ribosome stability and mRNA decay